MHLSSRLVAGSPQQLRCHLLVQEAKKANRARARSGAIEVKESQDGEGTTEEIALLFALVGVPPRGCCGCVLGGRRRPRGRALRWWGLLAGH